ncbi:MAG TPA: aldo/keto reductase [Candidatus Limnocylindrales bacterium]|nr:aldo/keto reductase [Candidatus Limnocylindrales bacterium]
MPFEPTERTPLGHTGLSLTRLGLGGASIGGLFEAVSDDDAVALVDRAWELGIRTFDVAPLYGYGAAERRVGRALATRPRDEFVLSTKVGRLVRHADAIPAGADIDAQSLAGRDDAFYARTDAVRLVFDYSAEGVRRSLEESLDRLGLDRIDIALIHDPDDHWEQAIGEAWPALARLRDERTVRAIGTGMNQSAMLARFAREGDFDVFLLANRYTLLDQTALADLLPLCVERGIGLLLGGVMNSGVLADPRPDSRFDYRPAPPEVVDRARRIAAVCERHGVPLRAAAIQFPLAHPAVASLIAGVRRIDHLEEYPAAMRRLIPAALWADLRGEGLLAPAAPVPQELPDGAP